VFIQKIEEFVPNQYCEEGMKESKFKNYKIFDDKNANVCYSSIERNTILNSF